MSWLDSCHLPQKRGSEEKLAHSPWRGEEEVATKGRKELQGAAEIKGVLGGMRKAAVRL